MNPNPFHIHLHGPGAGNGQRAPLPVSFEQALESLEDLEKSTHGDCHFYSEPDGSFSFTGDGCQLVGMLYDAAGCLQYVELRGNCRRERLAELVACFTRIEPSEGGKDGFEVMVLPAREWKSLQDFVSTVSK